MSGGKSLTFHPGGPKSAGTGGRAAIASLTMTEDEAQKHDEQWVAQYQEVVGRITQEYRNRIHLLDDTGVATSTEAQRDTSEMVQERRQRYVKEMELRLRCIQVERDTLYAERQMHRINDEMLRALVSGLLHPRRYRWSILWL